MDGCHNRELFCITISILYMHLHCCLQKGGQKRGPPAFSRGDGALESQEKKQRTLSTFFTQKVGPDGDSQGHKDGSDDEEIFEDKVDTKELAVKHKIELDPRDVEDEEDKENRTGVKAFINCPVSEQLLKDD